MLNNYFNVKFTMQFYEPDSDSNSEVTTGTVTATVQVVDAISEMVFCNFKYISWTLVIKSMQLLCIYSFI